MALPPSRDSEGRVATSEDVFFAARSDGSSANSLAKCATGKITTGRNDTDEELVTIRPAVSKSGETLVTVTAPEEFVGPGMTIAIAGLTLKSPLVYVATGQVGFLSDPSLIDLALPVAASSRTDSIELPPLTSYRGGTNVQRRQYLDWLAGGRRDATIPSDYVLLYLQGLERHVLIGRKDFAAVAEELLRLLWFHGPSRLFHDALSSLLLTTVWLGLQRQQISTTLLNDAIRLVGVKSRSCLTTFLAILYQSGQRLSAEMAIKVCACIAQTRGHDFTERHVTLFEERYRRRFLSVYPNGFHLRNELGSEQLEYVPINPLLSDWTAWYPVPVELSLPINLDASVQLQPLMVLWTEVIADLKEQLGEPQPDAECKPASSEIPASPPPTTITPGADLPPVNDELIFQWLQPPTISTPESEPPPNSPPNPKPADAIVQRHPSADTCALVSESELVGIETIPVPFKLSQPESLAILPTASEIVTPTLPTIVTPRADARPSDRAADNSTASLTANEQQLVTIPPVVPPSRRLFLSPPANEKERDTIRRVVPPSGRTTAEQHHLEQELVTIRPAIPPQSSLGMFPPKEPRKLGETPEPIPDPLKLSQPESLPILPTASEIETPTLPTIITLQTETISNDPHVPKTWGTIVQRHTSADGWALADIEGIPKRSMLSPAECLVIVSAANRRGFALEPDTRITGQQYRWDELVSVFPQSEELPGDLTTYRAASAWLRLGITVALADGEVYYVELSQLFAHLKSQFALSTRDTVRLDHLRYLLTKTRQSDPTVAGRLRDQLDIANRSQLGKFLVSIAEADGDVSPQEQSVLEQIYGELGIPFSLVQHLPVTSSKLLQVDSTESGAPAVANSLPKITTEPVSRRGKIVAWVVTLLDDPDRPFRVRLNLGEHYFVEFPTDGMISRLALSMRRAAQQSADLFNRPTKKVAPPRIRQSRQTTVKKMPPTQLEDQPVMGFGQSQQTSVSESPPAPSLELDFKRVEQIKAETAQVAAFLGEVWRDEDEPSVSNAIVAEPPRVPAAVGSHIELPFEATALTAKATGEARFVALAPRFVPFVERLAKQPQWSRTDLDRLARELGMMVDGAVDAVNEWAHEQFGDLLLIDEGDIFLIQSELLIDHTGPT